MLPAVLVAAGVKNGLELAEAIVSAVLLARWRVSTCAEEGARVSPAMVEN
jgi:hypothetical protein